MPTKAKAATNGHDASETTEALPAIRLQRLARTILEVPIEGITPLITHNWSEKSKRMMLEAQTTRTRARRDARDPVADYEAAFHRLPDGRPGMPSVAFKAAMCDAARFYDGITITALRTAIFVHGEGSSLLVPIVGDVRMREDTVRNATGVADLRYRPEFWPWSATLRVEFLPTMLDASSVLALVDASGRNGIGDWRPNSPKSRTGTFGQFAVTSEAWS